MNLFVFLVVIGTFVLTNAVLEDGYYRLLDVSIDASKSEIRKAFKKLALEKHPDKNKGDSKAHEAFLHINKAYEVLKDEDLRKKYDQYGEAGLKDDHFTNKYQSWTYYNEQFGIYDDDPEIITLSKSDFEQSVLNSEDVWFINFYSPHCSHCHTLAPSWRELSEELSGVVRIGAVNCHDEWMLCNHEGIRSYPSLRVYPSAEEYYGEHNVESMVKFIFERIQVEVKEFKNRDYDEFMKRDMPRVLSLCAKDMDCLSHQTLLQISAMLEGLVEVGLIDCNENRYFCMKLNPEFGVVFSPQKNAPMGYHLHQKIDSYHAKEIVNHVLGLLPSFPDVDDNMFQQIRRNISEKKSNAWLFYFTNEDISKNQELRKLEALVEDINIGTVHCGESPVLCNRFLLNKHPTVMLYKKNGYEIHHGRNFAHDIANFARESLDSNVKVMGPDEIHKITQSSNRYFVDFFAPWCPPCMKLLPEWRKAGRQIGGKVANFGTVDCTVHKSLCNQLNIHSYPTTIFYNQSRTHVFSGYHTAEEIIQFAEDIRNPPVIIIDPTYFEKEIVNKPQGVTWVLKFFAPWCQPCNKMAPAYSQLAKKLKGEAFVGEVDCQRHNSLCQNYGVTSYPTVRLLPANTEGYYGHVQYQGWRNVESMFAWAYGYLPSVVVDLSDMDFYSTVLDSEEPWLVDFYTPWCGHCTDFAPHFQKLGNQLMNEKGIRSGKVDCQQHMALCQTVGVRAYPTLRFYAGITHEGMSQPAFGAVLESHNVQFLYSTCSQLLKDHLATKNVDSFSHESLRHDEF